MTNRDLNEAYKALSPTAKLIFFVISPLVGIAVILIFLHGLLKTLIFGDIPKE